MSGELFGIPKGEPCIVCDECKPDGIHLYTSFICTECEKEMVATDPIDPRYDYYVKKLKSVKAPPLYS
ncbi:sigma factor G inhibitor Gin [Bacillus sp. FJAT-42376]|uniref:sigma factor G inhibitor Gin n=1 Tax=Bacillus sp. FJAT-42376 TaxID=2014076 RepID=UPI0013DE2C36|nr:sigma factor G inhibitor Gin [Bacillus sp. FJAT-42376]